MLTFLLGPDTYSKAQYIDSIKQTKGADLVIYAAEDELPTVARLIETDLFSKPKIFEIRQAIDLNEKEKLILSKNDIIISLAGLDKRKKENKEILNQKNILVKNFLLPHGKELNIWIKNKVGELNIKNKTEDLNGPKISDEALNELAVRLGRDDFKEIKAAGKIISTEEVYNLWQAENEINKLLAFCGAAQIDKESVELLVTKYGEIDVLDIVNAIAEKNRAVTFELIQNFFKKQNLSDEKAGIILLSALLSEQFRNVLIVQNFVKENKTDMEILTTTGWKPGRLFVIKKISSRFANNIILDFLNRLVALDEEIKTSNTPPKVLLDLILVQMF